MRIRAKYIGENKLSPGSKSKMMYVNGRTYTLNFDLGSNFNGEKSWDVVEVCKFNMDVSDSDLRYRSLKSFLDTWEVV